MSNTIFLFMFGLTVGILLSMTLVSRYQRIPQHGSNEISTGKEIKEIAPGIGKIKLKGAPFEINGENSPTVKTANAAKSSESFWVPGREGAYLKFKNDNSAASSLAAGTTLGADGNDLGDIKSQRSAVRIKNSRNNNADTRSGDTTGVVDTSNVIGAGQPVEEDLNSTSGPGEQSNLGLGPLGAGPRSNGKRKRGPKSRRDKTKSIETETGIGSVDILSSTPISSNGSIYKGGDNANIQSRFFNRMGERVDPLDFILKGAGAGGSILYDFPPLMSYHSQAHQERPLDPPYIPSLPSVIMQRAAQISQDSPLNGKFAFATSANVTRKPLPNMSQQKGVFEAENLKLHLCNGVFEAYSGSYLTTKAHMLTVIPYNLSWVNCEMASFIHMKESNKFYTNPMGEGMIMQSLDVLDFSVIHLSAYERSSKKYRHRIWKTKADLKTEWTKIEAVKRAAVILDTKNNPLKSGMNITWSEEAKRTVAIMPFLGGAMGAGHSELGNRFDYLKACFWSIYEFMPNIVAGVSRKEDVEWCKKESGLPFYDVMLLENLPKGASLPVGTTQMAKDKLRSGEWPFEYVFFTESDQILISRTLPMMYDHLKKYPGRMILPHRLMPYSKEVITMGHQKTVADIVENQWMEQSCCLERQNCVSRKDWKELSHTSVQVINYYGLYVPLGNVNFLLETYRTCSITPHIGDYCP